MEILASNNGANIIAAALGHWRPKVAAATAIIAATLGHWRRKVAASTAVVPLCWATGGRLPAACPACCLRPQVTCHCSCRHSLWARPRPWGVNCRSQRRHMLHCYLVLNDTILELISGNLYQNFVL